MSARIIILPVIRKMNYTFDALEQRDRQIAGEIAAQHTAPDRTRPLLVINNDRRAKRPRRKRLPSLNLKGKG